MSPLVGPDFCPRCGQAGVAGTGHTCPPRSFKPHRGRLYRRAVTGDSEFGRICPRCAGPKTDQALRCRACLRDRQIGIA